MILAYSFDKILVIGIGKVGSLVATLLQNAGFQVVGADVRTRTDLNFEVKALDVSNTSEFTSLAANFDAIVSCLPYNLCIKTAEIAQSLGIHYFDLTEDVRSTTRVRQLAETSRGIMAPQCGLAPGFIAIVGAHLAGKFERLRSVHLRVGALPRYPSGLLAYAFNWSSEGVVNEYLNDCEVISDGVRKMVSPMSDLEAIVIDGTQLEAFTTSGGLGTMCETYADKVGDLNYKTIRYPGHRDLMRFFFYELHMKEDRIKAGEILVNAKPPVDEDVVYIHAAVEGWRRSIRGAEILCRDEFVRAYKPVTIGDINWRAISWTTASSVAAVVELAASGKLAARGFIKQEEIALEEFLKTQSARYYAAYEG